MSFFKQFISVKDEGYTLIIVLWVLVILGIIFVNLVDEAQLNNLLVEDNLKEKKIDQATVSGLVRGINSLQQDQTEYDGQTDNWTTVEPGQLDELKYEVKITGVSRLNINYSNRQLLSNLKWWTESLEKELNKKLLSHLVIAEDHFENNYSQAKQVVDTYGKFNLNTGRLEGLKKLMQFLDFDEYEVKLIIDYLRSRRQDGELIAEVNSLKELYLKGLSPQKLQKLRSYITAQGTLNINFAPRRVLEIVFSQGLEVSRELSKIYADIIIDYRQQQPIKEIKQLKEIIYQDNWSRIKEAFDVSSHFVAEDTNLSHKERIIQEEISRIKRYFRVASHYFLIQTKVLSGDEEVEEINNVLVKRKSIKPGNWQVEVLRWQK